MNKKIAIMQPYLFPYIGYWQLIRIVDTFVVLDDVNYIKKGWINRNYILNTNDKQLFIAPIQKVSQHKKINEINLVVDEQWKQKFLRSLEFNYKKAPHFEETYVLVKAILMNTEQNLSKFIVSQLKEVSKYLGIATEFKWSSSLEINPQYKGQDKILEICKKENATEYINPIGGTELYNATVFENNDIQLHFLKTGNISYKQLKQEFVPYLSIIDVLMFNSKQEIEKMLADFSLQ